jgi:hypothetical protein
MLLNEFLKEHRKVQEQGGMIAQLKSTVTKQEATITELKKGMETVVAQLREQDSKLQKVSAQVEVNRSATKVAETSQ